ncbi:phosphatase PAP2 family protein [Parvibaculum sp.]|uniref:phosphatase PAP2 family protein n=1 Tax=Parvibaculum sp. TaxID=2024848 RepID=UPI0032118549
MRSFPLPTALGWWICLTVALIDVALIGTLDFSIKADWTLLRSAALLAILAGFTIWYARRPSTYRLAVCTSAIIYLAIYSIAVVLMSYLFAAADMPLADATFVHADRALGFDWMGWLSWVNEHPRLGTILAYAYQSSMPQVACVLVLLAFTDRHEHLSEFLTLFWLTTVTTITISALLPAIGAYEYFQPARHLYENLAPSGGIAHIDQVLGLRNGTNRVVDLANLNGLVAFPSFHTQLAVITTWAFWRVPFVRYPAATLNGLVVMSTPTQGGHYLVDILAGGSLAILFILFLRPSMRGVIANCLSLSRPLVTLRNR